MPMATGEIFVNGQAITKRLRRQISYVVQEDIFLSSLTLAETLHVCVISAIFVINVWNISSMSVYFCKWLQLWSSLYPTLQWRHNECDGVSNHQPRDCLFKRLFRRRSKKTSKLRVNDLFDRWIPHTKGQWRGKCFHSIRHHDEYTHCSRFVVFLWSCIIHYDCWYNHDKKTK